MRYPGDRGSARELGAHLLPESETSTSVVLSQLSAKYMVLTHTESTRTNTAMYSTVYNPDSDYERPTSPINRRLRRKGNQRRG